MTHAIIGAGFAVTGAILMNVPKLTPLWQVISFALVLSGIIIMILASLNGG